MDDITAAIDNSVGSDICANDLPFGNKSMILDGDFRQTLPVVKFENRAQIVSKAVTWCPFWQEVIIFRLVTNMRCRDQQFNDSYWALAN